MSTTCTPKTIVVEGINYVPESTEGESVRIVILQRGWVFVGFYSQDGDSCKLRNAQNIRVWGTTKGLGEIAGGGPTATTKLDPCGVVEFHRLTEICNVACDKGKWECLGK